MVAQETSAKPSHFIIREDGQIQVGHSDKDLFLKFLVDSVIKVVFALQGQLHTGSSFQ
jgi:hypothetical protein